MFPGHGGEVEHRCGERNAISVEARLSSEAGGLPVWIVEAGPEGVAVHFTGPHTLQANEFTILTCELGGRRYRSSVFIIHAEAECAGLLFEDGDPLLATLRAHRAAQALAPEPSGATRGEHGNRTNRH